MLKKITYILIIFVGLSLSITFVLYFQKIYLERFITNKKINEYKERILKMNSNQAKKCGIDNKLLIKIKKFAKSLNDKNNTLETNDLLRLRELLKPTQLQRLFSIIIIK